MNYYGCQELAASFRTVRKNTLVIAEEIPEEQYSFRATPDTRTVAQTLVHIALSTRFPQQIHFIEHLANMSGFDFFTFFGKLGAEEQTPRSKAEIIEMLRSDGEKFAQQLEGCPEEFLAERVEFPQGMTPPTKCRFEMLMSAKEHEMHHRGHLMLTMRMLGMVPPLTREMNARIAAMQAQAGKASA
jgi:uncharacterized damage-inducible protein DinB